MKQQIEYVEVEKLIPYARNSRTHSDEQVAQICGSIKEFGFTNPVLIDGEGVIIAGHGRTIAAQRLNMKEVPCLRLDYLTEAQKKAYVIADNKLALNAGWDDEMLALELGDLKELDFDLSLTGFDDDELNKLLAEAVNEGLVDEDEVPMPPDEPISKLGDVWQLGSHRVMCADSTSIDAVDKLMEGQKADMVFTDPPYGMSYGGGRAKGDNVSFKNRSGGIKAHGMIKGDDLEGESLINLVRDAIGTCIASSKQGAAYYICFTWRTYSEFEEAIELGGASVANCIVWDKKSIGLGNANYRPQHEFIFYVKGGAWYGDKGQSDVWYMSRGATGEYVHPTQKPVELVEKAISNSSKPGDLVLDVFGGSGSTLIACEKTSRHCRLVDLDPKYVDVMVKRWQDYTGKQAIHAESGKTFAEMSDV
jgi:DNA modification methylase